jgi:hypothetical protein
MEKKKDDKRDDKKDDRKERKPGKKFLAFSLFACADLACPFVPLQTRRTACRSCGSRQWDLLCGRSEQCTVECSSWHRCHT